tara:strand:+ start:315 stop:623 length:309 start_codon:yes stop_codon:yes gene_type:complete
MDNTNSEHSIPRPTHAGGRTNEFEGEAPPSPAGPPQRLDHGGERMSETFTYTHEELEQMIEGIRESYNVREVVCVKTGRRFPMRSWNYGTGEVLIDTTEGDE